MAGLPRKTLFPFARDASNNGAFGTAQLGTKILSNDPETIQQISAGAPSTAWLQGWLNATISSQNLPPLEEMQGVQYVHSYMLSYLLTRGWAEWDDGTTYSQWDMCKKTGTWQIYGSLIDSNTNNALPAAVTDSNWKYLGDLSDLSNGGNFVEKTGDTMTGALVMSAASINTAQGANVTAASTIDLDTSSDGNYVQINGNTTINRIVLSAGHIRILQFAGTPILTYGTSGGGNNINLPGAANITAAIGDRAIFVGKSDGIATCIAYTKNDGKPVASIFSKSFTSADQTITSGGALTLAHGLGTTPTLSQCFLKNTSAEIGYSVGDIIPVNNHVNNDTTNGRGQAVTYDGTNIYIRFGSVSNASYMVIDKSNGNGGVAIDNTKWSFFIRAWA